MFTRDCALGAFTGTSSFAVRAGGGREECVGFWLKRDFESETLQSPDQAVAGSNGIKPVKVISAHFAILLGIPKNAKSNDQDSMRRGDNGLASSMLTGFAIEECRQVTVLPTSGCPCGLTQSPA